MAEVAVPQPPAQPSREEDTLSISTEASQSHLLDSSDEEDNPTRITIRFTPQSYASTWSFPANSTLDELILRCDDLWPDHDWNLAKLMPSTRRPGVPLLLKAAEDGDLSLDLLSGQTLKILAQKRSAIAALNAASAAAAARRAAKRHARHNRPAAARTSRRVAQEDAAYTFHTVRALPYLPRPERSLALLERLKDDAGIRHAMRRHRFSVGLLTEMEPAAYTEADHEGTTRILGLNRNQGEVIELRLRTDAGDGYRDYNTIRKTLCHELAHNVHGPHDGQFWELCRRIEGDVSRGDWRSGGRTLGEVFFAPARGQDEDEEVEDHGAWTGGSYVLGGGEGQGEGGGQPLNRREILARAAEARVRGLESVRRNQNQSGGGSGAAPSGDGGSNAS